MTADVVKQRIQSIDILRGLVMVIMALDHVRDFFHITAMTQDPLAVEITTPQLFFTRWITHFCAPTFVFLSGLSAALAAKYKPRKEAAIFLMKRGLWLIIVEIVVITLGMTFNPLYNAIILQVIWATGWSMLILGFLIRFFPDKLILFLGVIIVAGHNLFDSMTVPSTGVGPVLLQVFVTVKFLIIPYGENRGIGVMYAILPWAGVMMLGYSMAKWYIHDNAEKRKKKLMIAGMTLIGLFILLRWINVYGDPRPYSEKTTVFKTFLSFLNTNKYPPSLLYLCMTIGPSILLLSFWENTSNRVASFFKVYGKVPFFYYVLHFYLIHIILVVVFFATGYGAKDIVTPNVPFLFRPVQFGFNLPVVYLIWLSVVLILYKPCVWYGRYKDSHKDKWWLHYL
ncbi:MAG: hypothetical protein JWQ27_923 [Ferruginibacter sp.]|nr:hypothetical protein [Ferruginibacter sp.]